MEFFCYELQKKVVAKQRPIVIITSNNEKELPDAFLRRCLFHYIRFPEKEEMTKIVNVHYPDLEKQLMEEALKVFYKVREVKGLKKRPSTSELIDWIKLLIMDGTDAQKLQKIDLGKYLPQYLGALLKNEQDIQLLEGSGRYLN